MNKTYFTSFHENNIFHIFIHDILPFYTQDFTSCVIYETNIDKDNLCQKWRYFVFSKIYNNVYYSSDFSSLMTNKQVIPVYNYNKFLDFMPNKLYHDLYQKIAPANKEGSYILLNQRRNNNRTLYEDRSEMLLEDYLKLHFQSKLICCDFGELSPEEQYELCSKASIFISIHGASCTNLLFTQQNCPLIEINFRTHWYCDNVCDDHFYKRISMNHRCKGKLKHPQYHKADYHNLCRLLGKPYSEIDPIRYDGGFISRNPISKRKVFVDGKMVIEAIKQYLK